jgi:hypothetical protein
MATCTNCTLTVKIIDVADHFAPEIAFSRSDITFLSSKTTQGSADARVFEKNSSLN